MTGRGCQLNNRAITEENASLRSQIAAELTECPLVEKIDPGAGLRRT